MKNNSGASLIATVLTLLIFALFIAIAVSLVTTGSNISLQEEQGTQAFSIAEGGLETAILQFKNGTACNALPSGSLGAGSFTIAGASYTTATNLSSGISNTDVVIPVVSIASFASHGQIRIDSENIIYSGTSTVAANCAPYSAPCFTGAIRGTGAAGHINNSRVSQDECLIRSTGIISTNPLVSIQRVVEKSFQNPGAMVVYAKANGNGVPYFRQWDGGAWGPERTATTVSANINYLVLKFARTRNEAILGTLSSNGDIRVQVWNGSTWGAITPLTNIGTTNDAYRGFDIEYEPRGDRAIVVYNNNVANQASTQIWNGTNWSAGPNVALATIGTPRWIEMAPKPSATSDEIVLIALGNTSNVYGVRWNGAGWITMSGGVNWGSASINTRQTIDVGYEQQLGRAIFVWGSATDRFISYRIWDGANFLSPPDQRISNIGNHAVEWVRLAPDPYSNNIMLGMQDSSRDLITSLWNGVWDINGIQHEGSAETRESRNFDIVFETNPANAGNAWLVYGDGATVSRKQWIGSTSLWIGPITLGGRTALVQLAAHPRSGIIFAAIYESTGSTTDDIWEMRFTGGAWTGKFTFWGGPTVANPVMEKVVIASEKYIPVIKWREVTQ